MSGDAPPAPLLRDETPADHQAIHHVHLTAFGREAEAHLVDRLRDGGFTRLSLVAEVDGRIVGHILLGSLTLRTNGRDTAALALAPLAVLPEYQRRGIGAALVAESLRRAAARPEAAVFVLGEPSYYGRFGFTPEAAAPLQCPFPGAEWAFQAIELHPGALAESAGGAVVFPPPFAEV